MKQHTISVKRGLALLLVLCLVLPILCACESRAVPAGELALTEVGEVDGYAVLYEELYFLVQNDLPALSDKHGEDEEALLAALSETLSEQLLQNHARLRLCEEKGLVFDEEELRDEAQTAVDALIAESFDGDRNAYLEGLCKVGMTDHYFRFTAMVDALYDRLPSIYAEEGKVPVTDAAIRDYVKEHFVRTRHVAVLIEEGESYEENYEKVATMLEMLESGTAMNKVIGSKYNEDLTSITLDGHYFAHGSMEKAYEEVAFSLEENTHSGIIEAKGVSNLTGQSVTCLYIIERLPQEKSYVDEHLTELGDKCADAIISADLEVLMAELSFEPNEFYGSLSLLALEFPSDGIDWALILFWVAIVIVVAAVAVVTVLIVRRIRRKRREAVKKFLKK